MPRSNWAGRWRQAGFDRVDALRAKPWSPRVFFLLDAPDEVRQRAERIEQQWQGWITWHPDVGGDGSGLRQGWIVPSCPRPQNSRRTLAPRSASEGDGISTGLSAPPSRGRSHHPIGYVNRNQQEVIRPPTRNAGTDH